LHIIDWRSSRASFFDKYTFPTKKEAVAAGRKGKAFLECEVKENLTLSTCFLKPMQVVCLAKSFLSQKNIKVIDCGRGAWFVSTGNYRATNADFRQLYLALRMVEGYETNITQRPRNQDKILNLWLDRLERKCKRR